MLRYLAAFTMVAVASVASSGSVSASPILVTFDSVQPYTGGVASQLTLKIEEDGLASDGVSNMVRFTFKNNVGIASNVHEIYLSDGMLFGTSLSTSDLHDINQTNVQYAFNDTSPGTPSSVNDWQGTTQFLSADIHPFKGKPNGLDDAGDTLAFTLTLINGQTIADVLAALQNTDPDSDLPKLRIAMHVGGIEDAEGSDSRTFVNNVPNSTATPEPGTFALLAMGGVGLAAIRRRKKTVAA